MKRSTIAIVVILLVLLIDQALKFYIKTTYSYGEGFNMFGLDWARIHFVENKGMAFGMSFGGEFGKLALSLFRIIMVSILIYVLTKMIRLKEDKGLILFFSMIIAGAIGNIIDSAFYGLLFSESSYLGQPAVFLPEAGGYASFLHGKVVDMFYFPMYDGYLPDWLPIFGGKPFQFFRPVFNVADASISVGVFFILLFYRSFFNAKDKKSENVEPIKPLPGE